jgi:hypothetical protein
MMMKKMRVPKLSLQKKNPSVSAEFFGWHKQKISPKIFKHGRLICATVKPFAANNYAPIGGQASFALYSLHSEI